MNMVFILPKDEQQVSCMRRIIGINQTHYGLASCSVKNSTSFDDVCRYLMFVI